MKLAKGVLAVVCGVLLAGSAFGQVETEKKLTVDDLLSKMYGSVELRHQTYWYMTGDKQVNTLPFAQLKPTLGMKFFNDKLDASVTPRFEKNSSTDSVKTIRPEFWVQYNTIDSKWGTLDPIFWGYLPNKGDDTGTNAYLGVYGKLNSPTMSTPIGELYGRAEIEYAVGQNSRNSKSTADAEFGGALVERDSDKFSLNDDGEAEMDSRDPGGYTLDQIRVGIKPIKSLDVNLRSAYIKEYAPKYLVKDAGAELDGYSVNNYMLNRFVVSYTFDNGVAVHNQMRQQIDGFFESSMDKSGKYTQRYENRFMITADLF